MSGTVRPMRVVAGIARGTRLDVAAGSPTRPFLELARGALFNSLGGRVPDARVLDLYAGSGALGLEALSRGARRAVFVERDGKALAALRANIGRCGFGTAALVAAGSVVPVLSELGGVFDIVFIDPPFPEPSAWAEDGEDVRLGRLVSARLSGDGIAVLRLEGGKVPLPRWEKMELRRDREYGRSRVCIYGRRSEGCV